MQQQQNEKHIEELERYLRTFQPRPIRQLGVPQAGSRRVWRLAAAAIVIFAAGVLLWYAQRKEGRAREMVTIQHGRSSAGMPHARRSIPALTKLALDDSEAFDAFLTDESQSLLPSMQSEQSALRVLAKE